MTFIMVVLDWFKAHGADLMAAVYAVALAGSHIFPANTVAYKICQWILTGALNKLLNQPKPTEPPAAA